MALCLINNSNNSNNKYIIDTRYDVVEPALEYKWYNEIKNAINDKIPLFLYIQDYSAASPSWFYAPVLDYKEYNDLNHPFVFYVHTNFSNNILGEISEYMFEAVSSTSAEKIWGCHPKNTTVIQGKLKSGSNIKTINNISLLDSGNINTMQLVSNPVNGNILTTDVSGQAADSGTKLSDLQNKLTAGSNITINDTTISATDTKYTAGSNVQISSSNVISATNTKYTAGSNVQISSSNVISATDTKYTAASYSPITISGTTITNTNTCLAFGSPTDVQTHILSWITNFPNYNTYMCVANARPSEYPDAPAGEGAGYIVVSRKPDGDKNIGVTWTTLGGDVYKRVYSRSIYWEKGKPRWTGEWQLVGGTLNQIFRKIRYSVKSSGTPTAANAYAWSRNIALTGFKPVNYDLVYGNSSSAITSAEQFTDTTISGYCSIGNHSISVDVLYILGEAVSVSSVS